MTPATTQNEGLRIFQARRAAIRLLDRLDKSKHQSIVGMKRDELAALAKHLDDMGAIAERWHLERSAVGSLPLDAFPGPTE